jgi:hypothetical protein
MVQGTRGFDTPPHVAAAFSEGLISECAAFSKGVVRSKGCAQPETRNGEVQKTRTHTHIYIFTLFSGHMNRGIFSVE